MTLAALSSDRTAVSLHWTDRAAGTLASTAGLGTACALPALAGSPNRAPEALPLFGAEDLPALPNPLPRQATPAMPLVADGLGSRVTDRKNELFIRHFLQTIRRFNLESSWLCRQSSRLCMRLGHDAANRLIVCLHLASDFLPCRAYRAHPTWISICRAFTCEGSPRIHLTTEGFFWITERISEVTELGYKGPKRLFSEFLRILTSSPGIWKPGTSPPSGDPALSLWKPDTPLWGLCKNPALSLCSGVQLCIACAR